MNPFAPPKTKEKKLTLLQKIVPINLESEKEKFLFDQNYNPQFEYPEDVSEEDLLSYGEVSDEFLSQAKWVIDTVIKKYETELNFLDETEGKILHQDEATRRIRQYLKESNIEDRVELRLSRQFIARTAVRVVGSQFALHIRTPFEYREEALEGTLHHEVGTHIFRWINEMKQPWYKQRNRFQLTNHITTEEGIAAIHTNIDRKYPYIWLYALYYYAVVQSSKMSFSELFKDLRHYVQDKERCWKICLRVKRGIRDTSVPGTFTKDQTYLRGLMQLKDWLQKNDYDMKKLYIGKVAIEDWNKLEHFFAEEELTLPAFMENEKEYKDKVKRVYQFNHL